MTTKPIRQVTPPFARVATWGLLGTTLAAGLNYGWLLLCTNTFHWPLVVSKMIFNTNEVVPATSWRIVLATVIAGVFATFGAALLSKLVIGPRYWVIILGYGLGIFSLYSVVKFVIPVSATVVGGGTVNPTTARFGLAVMHIITTLTVVPALTKALTIHDHDLARADARYHEHVDAKTETPEVSVPSITIPSPMPQVPTPNTDTRVILDPSGFIGQPESDATTVATQAGYDVRVVERDGQAFPATHDFRDNRVNLSIRDGVVVQANLG